MKCFLQTKSQMGDWENVGHVFIIGLWELKIPTFYFACFVVSCKAITDPLSVCIWFLRCVGSPLPSLLSHSKLWMLIWAVYSRLRSSNCFNWNSYCKSAHVFFFLFSSLNVGTACAMCFIKSTAESFKLHPLVPYCFFLPPTLAVEPAGEAENKFGTHMVESTD